MEKHVAEGVAVDDALINHHLTDPYIFSKCENRFPIYPYIFSKSEKISPIYEKLIPRIPDLTKHPNFLAAASQILESPRLRLFSSRYLQL